MSDLVIRSYLPADFKAVLNMDGRPSERRAQKLRMVKYIKEFYCFIALVRKVVLGFVIMEDMGSGSHYMSQINVREKRKGIGRKLVNKVFEHVGTGGHISLCVNTENEPAIKFYESLGFKKSGFTNGYRRNQNKYWYQIDL